MLGEKLWNLVICLPKTKYIGSLGIQISLYLKDSPCRPQHAIGHI